jgi:hypothetical protein
MRTQKNFPFLMKESLHAVENHQCELYLSSLVLGKAVDLNIVTSH